MKNVLVIDDDPDMLDAIRVILEGANFSVTTCNDGVEGTQKAREKSFDLVITDILMPEKEGLETIMELKEFLPELPILAISSGGDNYTRRDTYLLMAKKLGATSSLEKPFTSQQLLKRVEFCLGKGFIQEQ